MVKGNRDEERRKARRFQIGWDAAVKGMDHAGWGSEETANLENLSSLGAFLYLPRRVRVGARLELRIKVPFKKNSWMWYSAKVVRVRKVSGNIGVALRFDTARPLFADR